MLCSLKGFTQAEVWDLKLHDHDGCAYTRNISACDAVQLGLMCLGVSQKPGSTFRCSCMSGCFANNSLTWSSSSHKPSLCGHTHPELADAVACVHGHLFNLRGWKSTQPSKVGIQSSCLQHLDSFTPAFREHQSCAIACACSSWQQMSAGPGTGPEALQAGMSSQPCSPTEHTMLWLRCSAWAGLTASSLRMWIACITRLAPVTSLSCMVPPTGVLLFTADGIHLPPEVCNAFNQSADFLSCLLLHEMQCQDVRCFWLKA